MDISLLPEFSLSDQRREAIRGLLEQSFPDAGFVSSRTYLKQLPPYRVLAEVDGELVGTLGLHCRVLGSGGRPIRVFGVEDLCVDPRFRGGGIATRMLKYVEDTAARHRIGALVLFASRFDLYTKLGFHHPESMLCWLAIDEHRSLGMREERVDELLVKEIDGVWPAGTVDLLGHLF